MTDVDDLAQVIRTVLEPLIRTVARSVLAELREDDARIPDGRLAFPEAEASRMLGVQRYVLRDCRLRGEIAGVRVGKKILYSRAALLAFLAKGDR